jgi:hypothetical protein
MNEFNKIKIVILIMLLLPSLLWSFWSFKMYKDAFSGTSGESHEEHFAGNKFIEHTGSGILTAGVCPLGKLGAWIILIWSIILISLLITFYNKYTDEDDIKRINKIFGIMNIVLASILFIATIIMNPPLFIRTLPFFYTQSAISLIILNSCSK